MEIFTVKSIVCEDMDGETSRNEEYKLFPTKKAALKFVAEQLTQIAQYARLEVFFDPNVDLDNAEYQLVGSLANSWYHLEFFLKKEVAQ